LKAIGSIVPKPTSVTLRGGERPYSVAVNPTSDLVAVGFDDTKVVEVYDSTMLAKRFAPDTEGVNNGSFPQVAWSADGTRLYAGGQYGNDNERIIRIWGRGGEGPALIPAFFRACALAGISFATAIAGAEVSLLSIRIFGNVPSGATSLEASAPHRITKGASAMGTPCRQRSQITHHQQIWRWS
jgi:WD40 repeat protein